MQNHKKNPRKKLENYSNVFMQLGLVLTLFVVFITIEHKTEQMAFKTPETRKNDKVFVFESTPIAYKKEVIVTQKNEPIRRSTNITLIEQTDNDHIEEVETVIIPDEEIKPTVVDENTIIEVDQPEEINDEDEPLNINLVSEIPIFAGCENLSKTEARKCFDKKLSRIVQRNFDTDLANDLGLSSGKKRIYAQFVIDKSGNVTGIKIRAPHPRLKKETQRIVNKIPKFTPGKQNGRAVKVKYTLPITFKVE